MFSQFKVFLIPRYKASGIKKSGMTFYLRPNKHIFKLFKEKTLEFAPGEWLLSSYIATGIDNVPIFIKADNAEKEIESFLSPFP